MNQFLKDLGLDPNKAYSPEEIAIAKRKLVKEHHPDKGGKAEDFNKVMHAYKMLTDSKYRFDEDKKGGPAKSDLDIRMQIQVSFDEAFFGCSVTLNFNDLIIDSEGNNITQEIHEMTSIKVQVSPGSCSGTQRMYRGKGAKRASTEDVGDLWVNVVVGKHRKFHADEAGNTMCVESIPLDLMIKGGALMVQTMYGLRSIEIPPGTKPGEKIIVPKCGAANRADHIVVCDPVFPTKEDLKSKAWKGLDINWPANSESEDINKQDAEAEKAFRFFEGRV